MRRFEFRFRVECVQSNRKELRDMRELMLATTDDVSLWLAEESPPSTYPQQDLNDIAAAFNEFSCRITRVILSMPHSRILEQLVPALTHLEELFLRATKTTQGTEDFFGALAAHDTLKLLVVETGTWDELTMKAIIEELPRFIALELLGLFCSRVPWPPKVFAIFVDFIEAQCLPPSRTKLYLELKFNAKREADETLPLMTRLVRKINSTPVIFHLKLCCGASICWSADGSLFRNFMSAVEAARNIELDICQVGGDDDIGKELMLAAQHYRGIRRLDLKIPQQAEHLEFLSKAKVKMLSLWGLALNSTEAREAMLQNVTIREVQVGGYVLPCEPIFKRNKLLATVVNKPPRVGSVMPLALYRMLQTDLGATPAHALLRGQVLPLLLENQLPPTSF